MVPPVPGNPYNHQLTLSVKRNIADSLSDILEIKVSIKPTDKRSERNQHLGEWGVNVHKELLSDILGRESTKVDFVKATLSASGFCDGPSQLRTYTTLVGHPRP